MLLTQVPPPVITVGRRGGLEPVRGGRVDRATGHAVGSFFTPWPSELPLGSQVHGNCKRPVINGCSACQTLTASVTSFLAEIQNNIK